MSRETTHKIIWRNRAIIWHTRPEGYPIRDIRKERTVPSFEARDDDKIYIEVTEND